MANLSKYKDLIEKGIVYIATSDKKCKPNLICVMGCKLVAKDIVCATDNMMEKTSKNIERNKQVAACAYRNTSNAKRAGWWKEP